MLFRSRKLCKGQFKVVQGDNRGKLSRYNTLYCKFDDIRRYGDNRKYAGKRCSRSYRSDGKYPKARVNGHWSQGFSTWGFTGATIVQLRYNDGRKGSHISYHSGNHNDCRNSGGCHTQVWCKSQNQEAGMRSYPVKAAQWKASSGVSWSRGGVVTVRAGGSYVQTKKKFRRPITVSAQIRLARGSPECGVIALFPRSEEHTSELQSP